jgi:hypothetical protein
MKTTTWLLVPLALTTASCLIELSPSAADPATTPAPFIRPDAAAAAARASDASPQNASANASPDASADASAPSTIDAAILDAARPNTNAATDASPALDAAPL